MNPILPILQIFTSVPSDFLATCRKLFERRIILHLFGYWECFFQSHLNLKTQQDSQLAYCKGQNSHTPPNYFYGYVHNFPLSLLFIPNKKSPFAAQSLEEPLPYSLPPKTTKLRNFFLLYFLSRIKNSHFFSTWDML